MNLSLSLLRSLDDPGLSSDEATLRRCELAGELEGAGNYEAAREVLGDNWRGVGLRPLCEHLQPSTRAELLLRIGSLTGWLGSAKQLSGSQDSARDLLSESAAIFEVAGAAEKAGLARLELAWCYWREGAYDEAAITIKEALERMPEDECGTKGLALVRLAEVERSKNRYTEALQILCAAEPIISASAENGLRGKFHSTHAGVLESLGIKEPDSDYADRALIELTAASYHFEQAGHLRYCARVENNLGFSLFRLRRFEEAEEHLGRARRLFSGLKEESSVAQADDTRARSFLAQGRNAEAERILRVVVRTLERCDERAQLSDSLVALGVAQTRLSRGDEAEESFRRAHEIGNLLGDGEAAGRALLTIVEEMTGVLTSDEIRGYYLRADELLTETRDPEALSLLRRCARRFIPHAQVVKERVQQTAPLFVHASVASESLLSEARCIAGGAGAVLISGETGTGKEVLARLVHEWSGRTGRFVAVNCAALCESLFESQVYGHRRGSFTDAINDHPGLARDAEGGTLYLDEIGELDPACQAKLLRLIDCGELHTLGDSTNERANARVVAATNNDLSRMVAEGKFRADLFYRLAAFQLRLTPLRERPEDIPALAQHFINELTRGYKKRVDFTPESVAAMSRLTLTGNARELRSIIERTFIAAQDGATVGAEAVNALAARHVQKGDFAQPWEGCLLDEEVRVYEGRLIRLALESTEGSITRAARLLGTTHQGLGYLLKARHKNLLPSRRPARTRRVSITERFGTLDHIRAAEPFRDAAN